MFPLEGSSSFSWALELSVRVQSCCAINRMGQSISMAVWLCQWGPRAVVRARFGHNSLMILGHGTIFLMVWQNKGILEMYPVLVWHPLDFIVSTCMTHAKANLNFRKKIGFFYFFLPLFRSGTVGVYIQGPLTKSSHLILSGRSSKICWATFTRKGNLRCSAHNVPTNNDAISANDCSQGNKKSNNRTGYLDTLETIFY